MPSVEELLNQDSGDEYADISSINDVITIDPETRTIDLPASETLFGTEQEMNVERKYFKCPKIVGDNIDLSKHQIYITYVTAKDNAGTFLPEEELGLYYCEDMNVDETGNYITFSWLLSGNVLSKAGFIAFAVCAKHMDGDVLKTRWKTKPAVGTVLLTVPDGEAIVEAYPDIITQLLDRMNVVEKTETELGKNLAKEKMDREQADISLQNDISGKLSEPVEGLAVGKYFRVAALDENGHAVLEAVDAKTIGVQDVQINGGSIVNGENGVVDLPLATNTKLGLVTSAGSNYGIGISGGLASLNIASDIEVDARTTRKAISPQNIDYAVKAAMCDARAKAWTEDEQAAARERMGLDGDYDVILDITVEEDCTSINVTTDANGNPFQLKGAILLSYLPASDIDGNYGMSLYYNNSVFGYAVTYVMSTSINTYSKHFAQLHNGSWMIGGTQYSKGLSLFSNGELYLLIPVITKNDAPYIDRIDIRQLNGGTIKAGATIKLMGVRE